MWNGIRTRWNGTWSAVGSSGREVRSLLRRQHVRREPLAETVEMMVGRWEKVGRVVRRVRRKVVIRRWAWHVWVLGVGRRGTTVCRRSEHHLRVGRSHVRGRGPVKPHSVLHHHLMMVVGVRGSGREMGRRVRQLLGQLGCQQQRFQSPSGATRLLLGLPCSFAVALIAVFIAGLF
jgi:hypothetical protein